MSGRGERPLFQNLLASRPPREARSALAAAATSAIVHGGALAALVWATMAAGGVTDEDEDVVMLIPVEAEEPPLPPPPPPVQVRISDAPPVEVAKGFQTLAVPEVVLDEIPPPRLGAEITERDFSGEGIEGGRADGTLKSVTADNPEAAPAFTPFTVEPRLKNAQEVARALERNYPPVLRDAGIGGRAVVWFFIDEEGRVVKTQINTSSGYEALDRAALDVAGIMQFSPALNRNEKVRVWVQIPIQFASR